MTVRIPSTATVSDFAAHIEGVQKDGTPFTSTFGHFQYSGWALDAATSGAERRRTQDGSTILVVAVLRRQSTIAFFGEHTHLDQTTEA